MKNRKFVIAALLLLTIVLAACAQAVQQAEATAEPERVSEYRLNITRTFGSDTGTGKIRGTFELKVIGDEGAIQQVSYRLDGQEMALLEEAPYAYKFQTQAYPEGDHTLSAVVATRSGVLIETTGRIFNFISSEEQFASMGRILGIVFGVVISMMLIGILMQFVVFRGKGLRSLALGEPRNYGLMGGGICPRCKRPFAFHWFGMNLVTAKFDRCDYCGRLGPVKRSSLEELREAEKSELAQAQPETPIAEKSKEEKLKEMLDQSKYSN
jgi:hypothetical protein